MSPGGDLKDVFPSLYRKDGKKIWTVKTNDNVDSSPVVCGDKVVVGSADGRLYLVSLDEGKELWRYEIGAAIMASPAVAGKAFFLRTKTHLYRVEQQ